MSKILIDTLRECEAQFRDYARQHTAKGTEDGARKAKTNLDFAMKCRNAVAQHVAEQETRCQHLNQGDSATCPDCGQSCLPLESAS